MILVLTERQVVRRDGRKCVLSGRHDTFFWVPYTSRHPDVAMPPNWGTVGVAHIFKCSVDASPIAADASGEVCRRPKQLLVTNSFALQAQPLTGATVDILCRYAQLSEECIRGMAFIDREENAISIWCECLTKFHTFGFCLVPTEVSFYQRMRGIHSMSCA